MSGPSGPGRALLRDASFSAAVAGFVAVLVGFTSSVAIVFQAARALGAGQAEAGSWIWALGLGMGLCTLVPSLWLRKPVMVAWSTPGAAVIATAAASGAFTMEQAVGAFLVSGALVVLVGATGWFERLMDRIPGPIAAGLLAGVLCRFGLDAFAALGTSFWLVLAMIVSYLLGRRLWPRFAIPFVLATGTVLAAIGGQLHLAGLHLALTRPVFVAPQFTVAAVVGLAVPLFVVTMASQNLPGVAVIRAAGYHLPLSGILTLTGVATLLLAPLGGYALNLAAITAAICMGREAHEDPARRYVAAVSCGVIYCVVGLFGGVVASLLAAFPPALVAALAGLALLGSIASSMTAAFEDVARREAALVTFLVTLSGVSLFGIGSAFWGVVGGALVLAAQARHPLFRF